jgi:hypothetical protein
MGKVCTSLLNNMASDFRDQRWIPGTSHLGQVMLAIQSQILVDEPGTMKGLVSGSSESMRYTKEKRVETLRWAIADNIRNPPKHFEKEIRNHFTLCRMLITSKV